MAGMLPGVECARRRRFHGSGPSSESPAAAAAAHGWTRRPSFCLYATKHETHHSSMPFMRIMSKNESDDGDVKLGGAAREAKERLDERLRNQRKSDTGRRCNSVIQKKTQSSKEKLSIIGGSTVQGELPIEVYGSRKSGGSSGSRRLISWLGWGASYQDDCAICLERFKTGETLVHLPCAHRFHSKCLLPWLETNVHCPYCRMEMWN